MEHDKFCQLGTSKKLYHPDDCHSCQWVQQIRNDQMFDSFAQGRALGYEAGFHDALRDAADSIRPMVTVNQMIYKNDALAAIEALGGKNGD